jgi:hypothetical protein
VSKSTVIISASPVGLQLTKSFDAISPVFNDLFIVNPNQSLPGNKKSKQMKNLTPNWAKVCGK